MDQIRPLFVHVLQLAIALVWIVAGIGKLRIRAATRMSVKRLVGGPDWFVERISQILPIAEIVLGGVLLVGWEARTAAATSAAAFWLFAFLIGRATIRDAIRGADLGADGCGCFGRGPPRPGVDPIVGAMHGPREIARNIVLAGVAMALVAGRSSGGCGCRAEQVFTATATQGRWSSPR